MLLLALLACDDLPPDWEKAKPIADFTQHACGDSPYDTGVGPAVVTAEEIAGGLAVEVGPVGFRCAQDVEGFWLADGSAVDVLVQPVNMNPASVAKCDCLYDLSMTVPAEGGAVRIWTRGDHKSGQDEPALEAEGAVGE